MIASSRMIQGTMLVGATVLHVAASQPFNKNPTIDIAAAGVAQLTVVGTAFANFTNGVQSPVAPTTPTQDTPTPITPQAKPILETPLDPTKPTSTTSPTSTDTVKPSEQVETEQPTPNLVDPTVTDRATVQTATSISANVQINVPRATSSVTTAVAVASPQTVPTVTAVIPTVAPTAPTQDTPTPITPQAKPILETPLDPTKPTSTTSPTSTDTVKPSEQVETEQPTPNLVDPTVTDHATVQTAASISTNVQINVPRETSAVTTAVAVASPQTAPTIRAVITTVEPKAVQPSTVTAQDVNASAVLRSQRPATRPADLRPKLTPLPQRTRTTAGNSNRNATAGTQEGTTAATATTSGSNAQAAPALTKASNAAVANYGGQIMRRVSRVRKPDVRKRGTAKVTFVIAASGSLSSLSISQSSGHAEIDQMALTVIRRAAPFPAPPAGARTRFSVKIGKTR